MIAKGVNDGFLGNIKEKTILNINAYFFLNDITKIPEFLYQLDGLYDEKVRCRLLSIPIEYSDESYPQTLESSTFMDDVPRYQVATNVFLIERPDVIEWANKKQKKQEKYNPYHSYIDTDFRFAILRANDWFARYNEMLMLITTIEWMERTIENAWDFLENLDSLHEIIGITGDVGLIRTTKIQIQQFLDVRDETFIPGGNTLLESLDVENPNITYKMIRKKSDSFDERLPDLENELQTRLRLKEITSQEIRIKQESKSERTLNTITIIFSILVMFEVIGSYLSTLSSITGIMYYEAWCLMFGIILLFVLGGLFVFLRTGKE